MRISRVGRWGGVTRPLRWGAGARRRIASFHFTGASAVTVSRMRCVFAFMWSNVGGTPREL
jgi:hypothetical protein